MDAARPGGAARGLAAFGLLSLLMLGGCAHADIDALYAAHRAEDPGSWRAERLDVPFTVSRRDCIGFAVRYRVRLMAAGIPVSDMTVMNVPHPDGRHAVLLVRHKDELWTLDQLAPGPRRWRPPDGWFAPFPTGFPIPDWAPASLPRAP